MYLNIWVSFLFLRQQSQGSTNVILNHVSDQRDTMEEIQKEVVRLCNGYPEGLPIQEIHGLYQRTYGKPLRLGTPKR